MTKVAPTPAMLTWARTRAGDRFASMAKRFPKLPRWELGEDRPTLKQLENFARATATPIGFLFLAAPPVEQVPIPDMRTVLSKPLRVASPDLLDTIYICQARQAWYRDYAAEEGEERLPFIGTATTSSSVEAIASAMRAALGFTPEDRKKMDTWSEALRALVRATEDAGILVEVNGVVGNNTHRPLSPDEFRGFALTDDLAPLVFVNGSDTKSAQMFTLAHEVAHLWLGTSALSDVAPDSAPANEVERWCNRVAAELLVPLQSFREQLRTRSDLDLELRRLTRIFKVSSLVILRRMRDVGHLTAAAFTEAYEAELARLSELSKPSGGGDFYLTQGARVGYRFARALIASTLEGRTLYRTAFRLLGFTKPETFTRFAKFVGFEV